MKHYYRVDVIEEKEIISVFASEDYEEACRVYDVWAQTHAVMMHEINL